MTAEDFKVKLDSLASQYESSFPALLLASSSMQVRIAERVFDEGRNTDNQDMLSVSGYSTKPIYVSPNSIPGGAGNDIGKRGTKIKSYYFPQGYKQLKQTINRGDKPLELTLDLRNDWLNPDIQQSGNKVSISLKDQINADKTEGLSKKFGVFFSANQDEIDLLLDILAFELTQDFNNL